MPCLMKNIRNGMFCYLKIRKEIYIPWHYFGDLISKLVYVSLALQVKSSTFA